MGLEALVIETYKKEEVPFSGMPYVVEKQIMKPEEVLLRFPLDMSLQKLVRSDREEIKSILKGTDKRKLLIIGPCSAWPSSAVVDYARQLEKIAEEVKDKIKVIMRVYTQKPRTTVGWTGAMNQPDPRKESDIEAGIEYCRKMMIDVLKVGLPLADEAVFTHNKGYFSDLLSWIVIGARSAEDQEHRAHASMADIPVGMKNPTSGDIAIGVNSVIAAQYPHVILQDSQQIRTSGNEYAHLVLRGGKSKPNYSFEDLKYAAELMKKVKNPSIIVDASHDNSVIEGKKDPLMQPKVILDVVESMKQDKEIYKIVKGFMIESFLKTGKQDINGKELVPGLSITDACIGIDETRELIKRLYSSL